MKHLYFMENESVSFMLLAGTEAYIHIIKLHEGVECAVENIIKNMENAKNTFVKDNTNTLFIGCLVISIILPLIIFFSPRILYEDIDGGYSVRSRGACPKWGA